MKEYIKQDADIRPFLLNIKKGKYLDEYMLNEYIYQSDKDYFLLIVTEQHIAYIDIKGRYEIWKINTPKLEQVSKTQFELILRTSDNQCVRLIIPEQEDVEAIYNMLQST